MGRIFGLWVSLNMLLCSVAFFPWAEPRETVCGLMGRWKREETGLKRRVAQRCVPVLDALFHRRIETCDEIAAMEAEARRVLYPDD